MPNQPHPRPEPHPRRLPRRHLGPDQRAIATSAARAARADSSPAAEGSRGTARRTRHARPRRRSHGDVPRTYHRMRSRRPQRRPAQRARRAAALLRCRRRRRRPAPTARRSSPSRTHPGPCPCLTSLKTNGPPYRSHFPTCYLALAPAVTCEHLDFLQQRWAASTAFCFVETAPSLNHDSLIDVIVLLRHVPRVSDM